MKALAILCAVANLAVVGCTAWFMWFIALFPWENTTPEERAADDWLVPLAIVLAANAVGLLLSIVMSWLGWASGSFALQTALGIGVLGAFIGESEHDGTFVAAALGVELVAFASVWLLHAHLEASKRTRLHAH